MTGFEYLHYFTILGLHFVECGFCWLLNGESSTYYSRCPGHYSSLLLVLINVTLAPNLTP